ncbi:hypothetical protein QR98_0090020 [Sarcoptes scabiei]|uniref:Uncharacterized protein n=1 Tax=Sarcoptes scabiei TaxID=52283 RepID=A0A132AHG6_SARSC|nr:hypothetical protein QR98_0090020 [Sarcoptes scabiei]
MLMRSPQPNSSPFDRSSNSPRNYQQTISDSSLKMQRSADERLPSSPITPKTNRTLYSTRSYFT